MSKLYYAAEANKVVKETLADEISGVILPEDECQDAETKVTLIKGMYMLAAALDEVFNVKDEEEE
jgi:hypothetical protein